jgi:hypothetical protein
MLQVVKVGVRIVLVMPVNLFFMASTKCCNLTVSFMVSSVVDFCYTFRSIHDADFLVQVSMPATCFFYSFWLLFPVFTAEFKDIFFQMHCALTISVISGAALLLPQTYITSIL